MRNTTYLMNRKSQTSHPVLHTGKTAVHNTAVRDKTVAVQANVLFSLIAHIKIARKIFLILLHHRGNFFKQLELVQTYDTQRATSQTLLYSSFSSSSTIGINNILISLAYMEIKLNQMLVAKIGGYTETISLARLLKPEMKLVKNRSYRILRAQTSFVRLNSNFP